MKLTTISTSPVILALACAVGACTRAATPMAGPAVAQPNGPSTGQPSGQPGSGEAEATSPFSAAHGALERWVHQRMEGKGLNGTYEERKGTAMSVFYFRDDDQRSKCKVVVISEPSAKDGSEIKLLFSIFSDRTFKSAEVEPTLRVLNQHHRDTFLSKAYIDDDLDLVIEAAINLPGRGVHEDFVYDVLVRAAKACKVVNEKLDAAGLGSLKQ